MINKSSSRLWTIFFLIAFVAIFGLGVFKEADRKSVIMDSSFGSIFAGLGKYLDPSSPYVIAANLADTAVINSQGGTDYINNPKIKDIYHRGQVLQGNTSINDRTKIYDSKVGVNEAIYPAEGCNAGNNVVDYLQGNNERGVELNGSWIVGIVTAFKPSGVAAWIVCMNKKGYIPVLRLCVDEEGFGACGFDLSDKYRGPVDNNPLTGKMENTMYKFYKAIEDDPQIQQTDARYVATLGPNEPKTWNDFPTFNVSTYSELVDAANDAADLLQQYRVIKGGHMWLSPAIFNLTMADPANKDLNYDVYHYLNGGEGDHKIRPELFDLLTGNTYSYKDKGIDASGNRDAYEWYKSSGASDYVKKYNLKVVITESGPFNALTAKDFEPAALKFCMDDDIEGFNLFRMLGNSQFNASSQDFRPDQKVWDPGFLRLVEQCPRTSKLFSLAANTTIQFHLDPNVFSKTISQVQPVSTGPTPNLSGNKGGVNLSPGIGDGNADNGILSFSKQVDLNGFIIDLVTDKGDIDGTANYIINANKNGTIPIVRMCYTTVSNNGGPSASPNCNFKFILSPDGKTVNDDDVKTFYNNVSTKVKSLNPNAVFIATMGPNEPGSNCEAYAFGLAGNPTLMPGGVGCPPNYPGIILSENQAAKDLQSLRVKNGGNMYIANGSFNIQVAGNNDATNILSGLDKSSFDAITANAYDDKDSAYKHYTDSLSSAGLPVIITEFGAVQGQASGNIQDIQKSYDNLCNDSNVAGILFFRAFQSQSNGSTPGANQPTQYSNDQLKTIADSCSQKTVFNTGGGNNTTTNVQDNSSVFASSVLGTSTDANSSVLAVADSNGGTGASCLSDDQVLFVGDSLTYEMVQYSDFASQNGKPNDLGEPGASTFWFSKATPDPLSHTLDGRFVSQLDSETDPSNTNIKAVNIMLGSNDCGLDTSYLNFYQTNLQDIVSKAQRAGRKVILNLIPPQKYGDPKACTEDNVNRIRAIIAKIQGVTIVDAAQYLPATQLRDEKHFNQATYQAWASAIRTAIGTCKIPINATSTTNSNVSADAVPFATEPDRPDSWYAQNIPQLRLKCDGGNCHTDVQTTMSVDAPLLQFSLNTIIGTERKPYDPVCPYTARFTSNNKVDTDNLFALGIPEKGIKFYPIADWGSAFNCATTFDLLKDFQRDYLLQIDPSQGSSIQTVSLKLSKSDLTKVDVGDITLRAIPSSSGGVLGVSTDSTGKVLGDSSIETLPERTITLGDDNKVVHKDMLLNTGLSNIRPYDSSRTMPTYVKAPNSSSNMIYENNTSDIIYGPEVILDKSKQVWSADTKDVGWRYAARYSDRGDTPKMYGVPGADVNYDFAATSPDNDKYDHTDYYTDPTTGAKVAQDIYVNWTCQELYDGKGVTSRGVTEDVPGGPRLPHCDFDNSLYTSGKLTNMSWRDGYCKIPEKYKEACLKYNYKPTDQIYVEAQNQFPTIDKQTLPDAMKTVSALYDKFQSILSERNMKYVAVDDFGLKLTVKSNLRDLNNHVDSPVPNSYDETGKYLQDYPQLIDNTVLKSRVVSQQGQYQYYDWLGYINVLQEYIAVFSNKDTPADNVVTNPLPDTNPGRKDIVEGGYGTLFLTKPLLTCDQVEICKKYSYSDLLPKFGADEAARLCPLDKKLDANTQMSCITNIGDDRVSDQLAEHLCILGFNVPGFDCKMYCNDPVSQPDNNNNPNKTPPSALGSVSINFPMSNPSSHVVTQGWDGIDPGSVRTGHCGIDYGASIGTQVFAAADGVVASTSDICPPVPCDANGRNCTPSQCNYGAGNFVKITHKVNGSFDVTKPGYPKATVNGDFWTVYEHLSKVYVKQGDPVTSGTLIGLTGVSGNTTGAHLHFETRWASATCADCYGAAAIGSCSFDPRPYMTGQAPSAQGGGDTGPEEPAPIQCTPSCYNTPTSGSTSGSGSSSGTNYSVSNPILYPVGRDNEIPQCAEPAQVVTVPSLIPTNNDDGDSSIQLVPEAKDAVVNMINAMDPTTKADCSFAWGYRSAARQGQFGDSCGASTACACHSEHQLGTAIDFRTTSVPSKPDNPGAFLNSKCYNWLVANAAKYGFINSYTDGNPDYVTEPWHWRYVPVSNAADFIANKSKYNYLKLYLESVATPATPASYPGSNDNVLLNCPNQNNNNNNNTNPTKDYKNVFQLIDAVEQATQTNKYFLTAILSLESGPILNKSVGNYITNGTAVYKGDPYDIGNPNANGAGAVGPMQFECPSWLPYGYPKGSTNLPCTPWNANLVGAYYEDVLKCTQDIGMTYKDGDILDAKYIGAALCGSAVWFNRDVKGLPLSTYDYRNSSSFSPSNKFWQEAYNYNCGSLSGCDWYADSAWGRANYFEKNWNAYESGQKGSECSKNPYDEWYYYHVDLGIACKPTPPGGECSVTTQEALQTVCN